MCECSQKLWSFSPRHCSAWSGLIDAQVPQCAVSSWIPSVQIPDSAFYPIPRVCPMLWGGLWSRKTQPSRPCKLPCIHWDVSLGFMQSLIFVSEWTSGASEGESFWDHQWYCFYQLQILLYIFCLCHRKNWLTWLLHSKFPSNYLWFSLIALALCPENRVLVPSVCLLLLIINPWVLFSFLSIALPLPDNDYDTFQTSVDCLKSPFNHLVQPGHIYLAPLILLYLAAILQGKMLPSNNPSPSWPCRNISYSQSQGHWSPGSSPGCSRSVCRMMEESISPHFTAWK